MTRCISCGTSVKPLGKFCGQCGAKVGDEAKAVGLGNASNPAKRLQVSATARVAIGSTLFVVPSHFVRELTQILEQHLAFPLAIVADEDPEKLQIKSRQALKRYRATGELKYVCLLGNWADVAPFRVADPLHGRYNETYCLTDSLYGCDAEFSEDDIFTAIPIVPVGRIPVLDPHVVAAALLEAPLHLEPAQAFAFAVSANCWSIPTQAIIRLFTDMPSKATLVLAHEKKALTAPGVLLSPGWDADDLREAVSQDSLKAGAVLLFNVHGGKDDPDWTGQFRSMSPCSPMVMTPDTIIQFNNAVLISEACYGGALGYDEPSIVEKFFTNGGKAFVGCSVTAWGSTNDGWEGDQSLSNADLIALHFLKALSRGKQMGEALTHAKIEALQDDPQLDDTAQKTVLSFNLFGAPWHSLKIATAASDLPRREARGSLLDRERRRRSGDGEDPSDALAVLRKRYLSRLPEKSRRFMIERQDAMRRITSFKDVKEIEELLASWAVSLDDCELEFLDTGEESGYVLFGSSNKNSGANQLFQLVMDSAGAIKKTLTSKG